MDVRKRIADLLAQRQWTVSRMTQESAVDHSTIFNMFQRKNVPTITTIEAVAKALGISMRQFFAEEGDPSLLTPQQEALLCSYYDISSRQRAALLHIMEIFAEQNKRNQSHRKDQEENVWMRSQESKNSWSRETGRSTVCLRNQGSAFLR